MTEEGIGRRLEKFMRRDARRAKRRIGGGGWMKRRDWKKEMGD